MEIYRKQCRQDNICPPGKRVEEVTKMKMTIKEKIEDILIILETSEGHKKDRCSAAVTVR